MEGGRDVPNDKKPWKCPSCASTNAYVEIECRKCGRDRHGRLPSPPPDDVDSNLDDMDSYPDGMNEDDEDDNIGPVAGEMDDDAALDES